MRRLLPTTLLLAFPGVGRTFYRSVHEAGVGFDCSEENNTCEEVTVPPWEQSGSAWLQQHLEYSTRVYAQQVVTRTQELRRRYGGEMESGGGLKFGDAQLWDLFPPAFNCPFRDRIGQSSMQGGGDVCNWQAVAPQGGGEDQCEVFSFTWGGTDMGFENEFPAVTGCHVTVFDPTAESLPGGAFQENPCGAFHGGSVDFVRLGLGDENGVGANGTFHVRTLSNLMDALGVRRLAFLKLDVKGAEWKAVEEMRTSGALSRVDQLSVVLHCPPISHQMSTESESISLLSSVLRLFQTLESEGLFPFAREFRDTVSPPLPIIQYSFVRTPSMYLSHVPYRYAHKRCTGRSWVGEGGGEQRGGRIERLRVLRASLERVVLESCVQKSVEMQGSNSSSSLLRSFAGGRKAIAVLQRGSLSGQGDQVFLNLVYRTVSLLEREWSLGYEHIILHEGDILEDAQERIRSAVGAQLASDVRKRGAALRLQFCDVSDVWRGRNSQLSEETEEKLAKAARLGCAPTELSRKFPVGYKGMCAFWFADFARSSCLSRFEFVWRIDDDILLTGPANVDDPAVVHLRGESVPGPLTLLGGAELGPYDEEGVMRGMSSLFSSFAEQDQHRRLQWHPPQGGFWNSLRSNVMLFNMSWVRSYEVQKLVVAVDDSDCIWTNRWGDEPLWGAVQRILGLDTRSLLVSVPHFHCRWKGCVFHHLK
uniref:Methyltransferase domain-containing protein n=1 Tax=Chromera velia CCMP2878 TaxID=1169474 RepID=A0A0G4FDH2_9ALVE|eukprot:Cvel_16318.t1-p1 / transcript=Cvel_16318.t1 / gene=Cvel_16318 / organism=Chromera_velia_CCMP2878 / gene_product=hypothetical protein / transcript_product=hypothetical protein / location=Cvel_scaffold1252:21170-23278(+) / protein_length=703 / sequence_SO=supercontig / SO=protein_coding / is_pseudo=false